MKFILGFCLLFFSHFKMGVSVKSVKSSAIVQVCEAGTPDNYEASKYKSFKRFLDSICYMGKLSPKKRNAFSVSRPQTDTLYTKHGLKLVKKMGLVKQYFFSEKGSIANDPEGCYSFLGIGNKCFNQDTLMCWQQFNYWPNSLITYNGASFIIMKGGPYPDNCVGGACRINFYPVIGIYKSDTSFHYFINTDDIAGLRYSDINHDGCLDFLSIQSGFTHKDIQRLVAGNKKYKNFNCSDAECYKITVFSFKKGQWEVMKDKNGEEYFMLIKLDDSLNLNSSFQLLMSNWI
ncbi:hypothetical protein [Chitinophaga sp.]|uniref:hypothetical protein n=1 Tax=Chitinophaga sp. TaxID=1869181 RepID=UPI0031D448F6